MLALGLKRVVVAAPSFSSEQLLTANRGCFSRPIDAKNSMPVMTEEGITLLGTGVATNVEFPPMFMDLIGKERLMCTILASGTTEFR